MDEDEDAERVERVENLDDILLEEMEWRRRKQREIESVRGMDVNFSLCMKGKEERAWKEEVDEEEEVDVEEWMRRIWTRPKKSRRSEF
ncbi:MAG: hypothetical protein GY821_06405 [Gammaproteobacteria bacterium]|nr:hypothetical protein [Gammaproteobacteria bacterium]